MQIKDSIDMNKIVYVAILFVVSVSCLFTSCDREKMDFSNNSNGYGQLNLSSLNLDVDVKAVPLSRASTSVDVSKYVVGIYRAEEGTLVSEWIYSEIPEIFQLEVGKYKVTAHAPNSNKPVFDEPYCEGSKTFEILKDQVTNIATIECKLHCIMVNISYTDDLKAIMGEDTEVTVTVNKDKNNSLTFKKNDETRSAYFPAEETGNVVDFKLLSTLEDDNEQTENTRSVSDVAVGYLVTMAYSLDDADGDPNTGGSTNASIKIDSNCEVEDINGNVRPEEPEIDDFPDGGEEPEAGKPTITSKQFDYILGDDVTDDNPLEVIVKLEAPETIAHVNVKIEAGTPNFEVAIRTMFGEAGAFDLAEPGEFEEILKNPLNFPVKDEVIGKKTLDFIITKFTPMLKEFSGGTHKFHITLIDKKGQSELATLTFNVPKEDENEKI